MARLALAYLGPFRATLDGLPAEGLHSNRLRALLAYLAVERGREHPREALAALLWPERSDREALGALRYALSKLHAALGDRRAPSPFLLVTRTAVQFNAESDHWLDVAEFEGLAGRQDVSGLERAASLYRGPFLHSLSVSDSPAFDEWLLLREDEYRRAVLSVLAHLASLHLAPGTYQEAARWARRQLELEPYREQAHRQLMLALALAGERSAALAQYEACRRLLAQELECEPEDETQVLYARIRDGDVRRLADRETREFGDLAPPAHRSAVPLVAREREGPGFVAREEELARLGSLLEWALAGPGGMALIAGEAGSGKSALLEEFARRAGGVYEDLIVLSGRCNAYSGAGDPYLPFREILQTMAGDVEARRAGGTLSPEQARRVWAALPLVGETLVRAGPDLIDTFVPGEALLQRVEGFCGPVRPGHLPGTPAGRTWQARLRDLVRGARERAAPASGAARGRDPQPDLFAQATKVLHTVSLSNPLLLVVDDLQWADDGTVALLFHLGRSLAGSHILLACAYRHYSLRDRTGLVASPTTANEIVAPSLGIALHELRCQWGDVMIDLERADGRGFVEAYIDAEPNCLGAAFRQALYDHTGGNPLFTVELMSSFQREGALVQDEGGCWVEAAGLNWSRLPPRVEAVIAGHMAGLSDEDRALLQAASVQGEQFTAEVAARVLGRGEQDMVDRLSGPLRVRHRLVEADRLERLAPSGQRLSLYRFRHALLQQSAYDSLDPVARARLHEATGGALEAIFAAAAERPPALAPLLGHHFEAAGLRLPAARALHDAGCQATALSAFRHALDHFDRGLALLAGEPPSPERSEIERLLQVARLIPQRSLGGPGNSALDGALARARQAGAGEAQGQTRLIAFEAEISQMVSRGQFAHALRVAEQMLDLATQEGEEGPVAHAHFWSGFVFNLMGNPRQAVSHFDWMFARQAPGGWARLRAVIGYDVTVHALTFSGINQWFLGYPDQALRHGTRAVSLALELGDLYGQAFAATCGSTTLFLLRGHAAAIQEWSELGQRVCKEQGLVPWQHFADVFLGWLAVTGGEDLAGIERMQRAVAAWQDTGMVVGTDPLVVVLAGGCLAAANRRPASDNQERTRLLATGLAAVEPWLGPDVPCGQAYQAELRRLQGELLLARDGLAAAGQALACFQQAIQLSRAQGALAWELRAVMSLVRLRQRQGETCAAELVEARQCLAAVYGRFTEGFAFPDLQEAAALIGRGE